ncbi:MAG: hypothetical protein PHY23_02125 [Oscillospiraceae bacterium]|nr:hypothetical protein [Oscillospiraceae bacterium]
MSGLHKRKSLKSLLQDAKDKMTQAPEHIRAAQVLTEMQEDLREKMSGVNVRGECPGSLSGVEDKTSFEQPEPIEEIPAVETPQHDVKNTGNNDSYNASPAAFSDEYPEGIFEECPGYLSGVNVRCECPGYLNTEPIQQSLFELPEAKEGTPQKTIRGVKEILPPRSQIVGERQRQLFYWLRDQGGSVRSTLPLITQCTGIEDRTLRRILTDWESRGVVQKRAGQFGIELTLITSERPTPPKKPLKTKKLRQTSSTALALNDLCPNLIAAGFTESHYLRIMETLEAQHIDSTQVWAGLRHAEWELSNGKMTDKGGGLVSSPVDWVYKSLISDGTYRIPRGYLSPAEKQRMQVEEELNRERQAREELERLRSEKEALELQRQVDALLDRVLADTQSELAKNILKPLPHFLWELGTDNPLFQRACRVQVESYLKNLVAAENVRGVYPG